MKTAVIQIHSSHDKDENLAKTKRMIQEAASNEAVFIALPEVFHFHGIIRPQKDEKLSKSLFIQKVAEDLDGPSLQMLQDLARQFEVTILGGSIYEKSGIQDKAYNTSVVISPGGQIQAVYRKIHLFNAEVSGRRIAESDYFLEGDSPVMTNVQNFNVGLSICYDLRFPELYREYYQQGVDILCIPSAFTKFTGEAHWHTLLRARAIESFSYVVAPNQVGKDNLGRESYGHSLIISPWGDVLAEASGDSEEIIYADLNQEVLSEKRSIFGL